MNLYIIGQRNSDGTIKLSLPSAVILYILNYCKTKSFHVLLVDCDNDAASSVRMTNDSLQMLDHNFVSSDKVPLKVANCVLPVIEASTIFSKCNIKS